jgi:hypothetical protein
MFLLAHTSRLALLVHAVARHVPDLHATDAVGAHNLLDSSTNMMKKRRSEPMSVCWKVAGVRV